jgi:hypothetical protein
MRATPHRRRASRASCTPFPAYAHRTDVFSRDRANIAALPEDKMKALSEVVR